jgi:hypothetical protein
MSTLGDVVQKLKAEGLDVRALLEQAGVPLLTPEQAAAQAAEMEAKEAETMQQEPDADDQEQKQ